MQPLYYVWQGMFDTNTQSYSVWKETEIPEVQSSSIAHWIVDFVMHWYTSIINCNDLPFSNNFPVTTVHSVSHERNSPLPQVGGRVGG